MAQQPEPDPEEITAEDVITDFLQPITQGAHPASFRRLADGSGEFYHPEEDPQTVIEDFIRSIAQALATGQNARVIIDLAAGRARVVVKQNPTASGWVVTTEEVE